MALTESNEVYSFGLDGLLRTVFSCFVQPRKVKHISGFNIVQCAAGKNFSLFLNADGVVFSSGLNDVGQLGLGDRERRATPVVVEALLPYFVVKVR